MSLSANVNSFNVMWKSGNCCLIVVDTKENSSRDAVLGSVVKAGQPLRMVDEKTFVFCAMRVGEERSVLGELINTKSCAHLVAFVSFNL